MATPTSHSKGASSAAVKACGPAAVLSHFSAAALWHLVKWDGRLPEVTVPGTATRKHKRVNVQRSTTLMPRDTTRRLIVPTTTPARTLRDLSSVLPDKLLRRAAREAQALKLVTARDLAAAGVLEAGYAPTRSELEDAVLDLIVDGGLVHPDVNKPLRIDGRRVVPDFRWPSQRLVIEADGLEWHDNPTAREDDAERQAILEADGERVLRVTWDQATRHKRQTLARLKQAGAPTLQGP